MSKDIEREALIAEIDHFINEAKKSYIVERWAVSYENSNPFSHTINDKNEVWWMKAQARQLWEFWQAAKAQAVHGWISTSDRMPKEGEEVLVHSLGQVRQVTRDSKWAGGFKERNCYGWQAAYSQSHWMPKSIELPEQYHFYYENDAKQNAMVEAQEQAND